MGRRLTKACQAEARKHLIVDLGGEVSRLQALLDSSGDEPIEGYTTYMNPKSITIHSLHGDKRKSRRTVKLMVKYYQRRISKLV